MNNGQQPVQKVLFVAPRLEARGTSEYTFNLAHEFHRRGLQTLVACVSGPMLDVFTECGLRVETFDRLESRLFSLTERGEFREAVADFAPEVVHLHSVRVARALPVVQECVDAPAVLTVHWRPADCRSFRKLSEDLQALIATSESVRREVIEECGVGPDKVSVIHNGLDFARIDSQPVRPIFCASEPVIGCIGPVEEDRGQVFFVRAAARLVDGGMAAQFVIAGEGEELPRIRKLVRKLGLQGHLTFVSGFSRYEEVLDALDVVVQSSMVDISGYSILEAMGHGRPVIAFDTGTAREIMADSETGRVVEKGSVSDLASAISDVTQNVGSAREMGNRARARVSEMFNVERIADQTCELYRRIMQTQQTTQSQR